MTGKVVDETGWNYTVVDNEIVETDLLDIYEKMLYIALKRFANIQTGEAFPGVKKLAGMAGMSERKARGVINSLVEKRFIKVEHRKNKTSVYTLLPIPAQCAGGAPDAGGHAQHAGGVVHEVQDPPAHGADELKKHELKRIELQKDNNKGDVAHAPVVSGIPQISEDDLFGEWWNLYAHKVGDKKKCRTRYKSLLKKNKHEDIMSGTKRYKDHLEALKARGEFSPNLKYPYTFLNGENFNDEYEISKGGVMNAINQRSVSGDDAIQSKIDAANERRKRLLEGKSDRDTDVTF